MAIVNKRQPQHIVEVMSCRVPTLRKLTSLFSTSDIVYIMDGELFVLNLLSYFLLGAILAIRAVYPLPIYQCNRYFGQIIRILLIIKCITIRIVLLI